MGRYSSHSHRSRNNAIAAARTEGGRFGGKTRASDRVRSLAGKDRLGFLSGISAGGTPLCNYLPTLVRDGVAALPGAKLSDKDRQYLADRIKKVTSGLIKTAHVKAADGRIAHELNNNHDQIPATIMRKLVSPYEIKVIEKFLAAGKGVQIASMTAIGAPPLAEDQEAHRDSGVGPGKVVVVVVDINGEEVTTQFIRGSHRREHNRPKPEEMKFMKRVRSSRLLFDQHCHHRGARNPRSEWSYSRIFITFWAKADKLVHALINAEYQQQGQLSAEFKPIDAETIWKRK